MGLGGETLGYGRCMISLVSHPPSPAPLPPAAPFVLFYLPPPALSSHSPPPLNQHLRMPWGDLPRPFHPISLLSPPFLTAMPAVTCNVRLM